MNTEVFETMDIKRTVKKVSAVAGGILAFSLTLTSAAALTLSDYPAPFVENGVFNGKIVIGENAQPADLLGVADISASLQAASKTPVSTSGSSVTVEGGEDYDEIALNGNWSTGDINLTDTKLEGFRDASTKFNDDDIDYHDVLMLGNDAFQFQTSINEEDFGSDIYMTVDASEVKYRVYFDDYFNITLVGTDDDEDELEFYFLGKWVTVQSVDSDGLGMSVEASSEHFLEEGDSLTIDNHEITLVRVGESSVQVEVDGQRKIIANGDDDEFEDADDFQVEVQSIFYVEGASDNGANLKLGADLTESAEDGNSVELFGEPEEEDEADWVWDIDLSSTTAGNQYVGIVNNIDREDLRSDAENRPALAVGEELPLPNNYASIHFFGFEEPADYERLSITIEQDGIDLDDDASEERDDVAGVIFEFESGEDYFEVGGIDTGKVWVIDNASTTEIWYEDGDDEIFASGETDFLVKIDDDAVTVTPPVDGLLKAIDGNVSSTNSSFFWEMAFEGSGDSVWFYANLDNDFFGDEDEEEAAELRYHAAGTFASASNIGTQDYDFVGDYGMVIEVPEDQFGSGNDWEMLLPTNQQKATLVVTARGTAVGATSTGGAYNVAELPVGLAIFDSDAEGLLGDDPLIVVGGPYVNTIAAELMGNPTGEQIEEMFEPGRAKIKFYEDMNAVLVAGYTAQDTVGAAYVLAKYGDYDLSGDEVEVVVPSLNQISIVEPTLPSMVDDIAMEEPEMEETTEE